MTTSTPPPLPPGFSGPVPPDDGRAKMALNLVTAVLSTLLALWLTVADFTYPGNLLFQDSLSMIAFGLYLSGLFMLVLVLAVLPKRIVIAANFLILARGAMGWPLSLVIDHSLACRSISLSLLLLSLYHLATSLRRPLLQIHLRPWLKLRHSLIAVILWISIGIVSIPVVILGFVEAGRSLMGNYVQISWGGVSLVERIFAKDGQRVHLIGMMHIGDGSFYTKLAERMRTPPVDGRRIVLTEGVTDELGILPAGFKSGKTYARLAGVLGLQAQNAPAKPTPAAQKAPAADSDAGVTFKNADIDVSALDRRHREVLAAVLKMLDTDKIAELLLAKPEGVTGRDVELLLLEGLLGRRNDALMRHFEKSAPGHAEVFIPWGAAHLPDIEQRLLAQGYTWQKETVRPIVWFWNKPPPPSRGGSAATSHSRAPSRPLCEPPPALATACSTEDVPAILLTKPDSSSITTPTMKTLLVPLVVWLVVLTHPSSANAALCTQCKEKSFIQSLGACEICQAVTSSGAFKLCRKCSDKLTQCEACQQSLKTKTDASPDLKTKPVPATGEIPKPKNKAYPAHWGAVPPVQTKDIRPLPGGYGMGSGTLAKWIQKNLDADAKVSAGTKDQKAKDVTNAEEIRQVEKKIADMEDFAKRARFTAEGLTKHQEQMAALRERLQVLKSESTPASK